MCYSSGERRNDASDITNKNIWTNKTGAFYNVNLDADGALTNADEITFTDTISFNSYFNISHEELPNESSSKGRYIELIPYLSVNNLMGTIVSCEGLSILLKKVLTSQ